MDICEALIDIFNGNWRGGEQLLTFDLDFDCYDIQIITKAKVFGVFGL
jgi:hypothetical protein